jgi:predicted Holliday junction resolvase-like endonuclease
MVISNKKLVARVKVAEDVRLSTLSNFKDIQTKQHKCFCAIFLVRGVESVNPTLFRFFRTFYTRGIPENSVVLYGLLQDQISEVLFVEVHKGDTMEIQLCWGGFLST